MLKTLIALTALALAVPTNSARICTPPVGKKWLTLAEMRKAAAKQGYKGFQIGVEAGCYEGEGTKNGKKLEVYFDPITGKVVKVQEDRD